MKAIDLRPQNDAFSKNVGVSFFIHFVVFAIFAIRAVIFPEENRVHIDAIRVDMVGLPDKIQKTEPMAKELPPTKEKEKPKEVIPEAAKSVSKMVEKVADPEAIKLDTAKKKERSAIDKLKQMDAINRLMEEEQEQKKEKALQKLKLIKGAMASTGSELHGVAKLEHDEYLSKIEKHIRHLWALPEWLARKGLTAQVQVTFDDKGQVTSKKIVKSSGNPSFDEIVLQTVAKAAPVPAPPKEFATILANEGILLGFPE